MDAGREVVTLGAHYPDREPTPDAISKDPVPNPRQVQEHTGIVDPMQIDGILQYYEALSYHKRKIYLHASDLKKEIKARAFQNSPHDYLKRLLERTENSKFYLDRIHEKLSNLAPFQPGQKTSKIRGNRNLEENILFLKRATDLALQFDIEQARDQANRALQDLNATQAQLDAMRNDPNLGTGRPNVPPVPPAQPQVPIQPNLTTSTPTRSGVGSSGQLPANAAFEPSGANQGFSFGAGGTGTGPGNSHNFGYRNFTWSRQAQRGTGGGRGSRGGFRGSRHPGQSGNGSQGFQNQPDPIF